MEEHHDLEKVEFTFMSTCVRGDFSRCGRGIGSTASLTHRFSFVLFSISQHFDLNIWMQLNIRYDIQVK
jgi:hypothetical protein